MESLTSPQYRNSADAVLILQTTSSSYDDRISALRFLHLYLEDEKPHNTLYHRRINQLVMDNVMQMIMNEDRTADTRKRQIFRTECFIILASLLGSDSLFGSIKNNPPSDQEYDLSATSSSAAEGSSQKFLSSSPGNDDDEQNILVTATEHSSQRGSAHISYSQNNVPKPNFSQTENISSYSRDRIATKMTVDDINISIGSNLPRRSSDINTDMYKSINADIYKTMHDNHTTPTPDINQNTRTDTVRTVRSTQESIELKLLKPVILKRPVREQLRLRALRERPSFFTGGRYRRDGFAPGVDPTNWLEQVRE